MQPSPLLLYAAAGALFAGAAGAAGTGWYTWQLAQREAAKRLQKKDADAATEALQSGIEQADLRRQAIAAGLNPDEVITGYTKLVQQQFSPMDVIQRLGQEPLGDRELRHRAP